MLALLSPAKKLDFGPWDASLPVTTPGLMTDTKALHKVAKKLDTRALAALMDLSEPLAELNRERFTDWTPTHDANNAKPAALAFAGDVYTGLDGPTLDRETLLAAEHRLAILSGFYGVLRPLDLMQPYRLEMGSALATSRGSNLYAFWGDKIARVLRKTALTHANPVIVNLASSEYFKAVDRKTLALPVVETRFAEVKDGKPQVMMVFAKRARGLMARWILEHRLTDPRDLRTFDLHGYSLDAASSTDSSLVFTRPWTGPAPKDD
jgi:cytoplasmic iron level regulating protein YaaA (DUF328/UPF0246 family)